MSQTITTITGNLINDPYNRRFPSGAELTKFRVAASRRRPTDKTSDEGKPVWEDVDNLYIEVECWGTLAANADASLRKGSPVIVVGRLVTETWQEETSEKTEFGDPVHVTRSKIMIKAHHIGFELTNYQVQPKKLVDAYEDKAEKGGEDKNQNFDERKMNASEVNASKDFDDDAVTQEDTKELVGAASGGGEGDANPPF